LGWKPEPPDPTRVAAALPAQAALVDLLQYEHFTPPQPGEHVSHREPWYVAFVIRAGGPTRRIDLGATADIDRAISAWRAQVTAGAGALEARDLTRLVWAPLVAHLDGEHTILIAPDGALNFLPWAALPDPQTPGAYLVERLAIATVGSGRHLVELARRPESVPAVTLLAVGGVDYRHADAVPTPTPAPRPTESIIVATRSAPLAAGATTSFDPLPGTQAEVEAIGTLFHTVTRHSAELLGGSRATKERLRVALPGHRYLHLATHGYFAPPTVKSALAPMDPKATLHSWEGLGQREVAGLYPGLLSGLVWAGANTPQKDPLTGMVDVGSGVMTAEEVAGLDLRGCELAVLSACETGLGLVAGGQGVQGLQRAFHQAGVATVVASLWNVDDAATSLLMEEFYTNLWQRKRPKLEALREAQLTVLRHPERVTQRRTELSQRGLGLKSQPLPKGEAPARRSPPGWWAAFVLSGEIQ
jgi:CHAT domain-containing protein